MKTLICALVLLGLCARGHAALRESDFTQWNLLAVQDEGRRKPLDTFAREALLRLTGGGFLGSATYRDTTGRVWEPDDFLLSVLLDESRDWTKEPLLLINYRPFTRIARPGPGKKKVFPPGVEPGAGPGTDRPGGPRDPSADARSGAEQGATGEPRRSSRGRRCCGSCSRAARMLIVPPPENGAPAPPRRSPGDLARAARREPGLR